MISGNQLVELLQQISNQANAEYLLLSMDAKRNELVIGIKVKESEDKKNG